MILSFLHVISLGMYQSNQNYTKDKLVIVSNKSQGGFESHLNLNVYQHDNPFYGQQQLINPNNMIYPGYNIEQIYQSEFFQNQNQQKEENQQNYQFKQLENQYFNFRQELLQNIIYNGLYELIQNYKSDLYQKNLENYPLYNFLDEFFVNGNMFNNQLIILAFDYKEAEYLAHKRITYEVLLENFYDQNLKNYREMFRSSMIKDKAIQEKDKLRLIENFDMYFKYYVGNLFLKIHNHIQEKMDQNGESLQKLQNLKQQYLEAVQGIYHDDAQDYQNQQELEKFANQQNKKLQEEGFFQHQILQQSQMQNSVIKGNQLKNQKDFLILKHRFRPVNIKDNSDKKELKKVEKEMKQNEDFQNYTKNQIKTQLRQFSENQVLSQATKVIQDFNEINAYYTYFDSFFNIMFDYLYDKYSNETAPNILTHDHLIKYVEEKCNLYGKTDVKLTKDICDQISYDLYPILTDYIPRFIEYYEQNRQFIFSPLNMDFIIHNELTQNEFLILDHQAQEKQKMQEKKAKLQTQEAMIQQNYLDLNKLYELNNIILNILFSQKFISLGYLTKQQVGAQYNAQKISLVWKPVKQKKIEESENQYMVNETNVSNQEQKNNINNNTNFFIHLNTQEVQSAKETEKWVNPIIQTDRQDNEKVISFSLDNQNDYVIGVIKVNNISQKAAVYNDLSKKLIRPLHFRITRRPLNDVESKITNNRTKRNVCILEVYDHRDFQYFKKSFIDFLLGNIFYIQIINSENCYLLQEKNRIAQDQTILIQYIDYLTKYITSFGDSENTGETLIKNATNMIIENASQEIQYFIVFLDYLIENQKDNESQKLIYIQQELNQHIAIKNMIQQQEENNKDQKQEPKSKQENVEIVIKTLKKIQQRPKNIALSKYVKEQKDTMYISQELNQFLENLKTQEKNQKEILIEAIGNKQRELESEIKKIEKQCPNLSDKQVVLQTYQLNWYFSPIFILSLGASLFGIKLFKDNKKKKQQQKQLEQQPEEVEPFEQ